MSSVSASTDDDYVYQEVSRLSIINDEKKLTANEVANLFEYFTNRSNVIAEVKKSLKYSPNDETRLVYLRRLLLTEQPSAEYIQRIRELEFNLFISQTGNARNASSVYKYVKEHGIVRDWDIESDKDIHPDQLYSGPLLFEKCPNAPALRISELNINQPFCLNVLTKAISALHLESRLLVLGDKSGKRKEGEVYADIIIGHINYRKELENKPPDLSKGLGWEVKNNIKSESKEKKAKGQLIKYARIYLTVSRPLSDVFYGCLTDGMFWKFVKIQLSNDNGNPKFIFEESDYFEWGVYTASLIAGIIGRYHDILLTRLRASGEKNESQNNDKTDMYRIKSSISSESLLASFIEEGIYIRLNSGNCIHVQITSHLGTGRECIVFLAQVHDYGIKDAVLKIEVCKDTKISQVYREISALHALGDLPCIPKILLEGYTMGGSLALLTDFAGRPLESWISDNGNIDDNTIFQIILDLLLCLEKIHARGYTHGDVAIRNVIQRNGHFYLIDFGLATLLQLHFDPCQAIIQDYVGLCQIIGFIKFEERMSFSELIGKLKGELKSLVVFVENASRWKITDEGRWLKKFGAIVKQYYERSSRKALLEITDNINSS